jgi:hypothetical protein
MKLFCAACGTEKYATSFTRTMTNLNGFLERIFSENIFACSFFEKNLSFVIQMKTFLEHNSEMRQ